MITKKIFKTSFILLVFGLFLSCSGDDDSGTPPVGNETQLVLTASTTETMIGEEITFSVTANGEAVSDAEILVDGVATDTGYSHVFKASGEYQVMAKKEGFQDSEAVKVLVKEELTRVKSYTENGQVTTFSYNADNYLSSYSRGSDVRDVIYDAENRIIQNGIFEYTYNNLGQVTKIIEQDAGNWTNKQATFIYNNQGLVVRSYNQFTYNTTTTNFTREFEYDTEGKLISFTEEEMGQSLDRFLISYDSRGNIAQIKRQTKPPGGTSFMDAWTKTYTYDDKNNPGYTIHNSMGLSENTSLFYTYEMKGVHFFGNYAFFMIVHHSPNNLLSHSYSTNSGVYFDFSYEYVYNEEGYPISLEETQNLSDGSTQKFYYSWEYETFVGE